MGTFFLQTKYILISSNAIWVLFCASQDIVIGTPGRMKDLIEMGDCRLKDVSFVVSKSSNDFLSYMLIASHALS